MAAIAEASVQSDRTKGGSMQAQTIPKPTTPFNTNGGAKLYDANGDTVVPVKHTLMAKISETSKEDVTLTKGMMAAGVAIIALIGLAITCGVLFVGWSRDDQSARDEVKRMNVVIEQMKENQGRMEQGQKELNAKFDRLGERLQEQAVKDAETKGKAMGYDVGRTDKQAGH
jgi:uncharacterized protein HemX